MSGHDFNLTLF